MSEEKPKINSLTQLLRVITLKRDDPIDSVKMSSRNSPGNESAEIPNDAIETMPLGLIPSLVAENGSPGAHDLARAAFEHTDVGLAQISPSGNYVLVNSKMCETLLYSREDLLGRPVLYFLFEEDADRERAELAKVLSGSVQRITAERRYKRADGALVWLRRSYAPIRDAAGDIRFLIQSVVDVTESRAADDQLKKTNAFLTAVISNSPVAIYTESLAGSITSWNRAAERVLGFSSQETMGNSPPFLLSLGQSDYEAWRGRVHKGETITQIETDVRRADNIVLNVQASLSPIYDAKNKVIGLVGMVSDISESRRVRAALEASEARFRRLTESAQDITSVIGKHGKFIYISQSSRSLLGLEPSEYIGVVAKEVIHPDDYMKAQEQIYQTLEEQDSADSTASVELRMRHANGSWRWFEAKFRNCINDTNIGGVLVNAREITDRKQAQERVQFLAFHDNLTGLPNRMLLQDRIAQSIARASRNSKRLAVLFVDLDNFKHVNDTLGHDAGDALLAQVAARLKSCVRGLDTIARQGGDEFIVLLDDLVDKQGVEHVAQKILTAMQVSFRLPQGEGYVTSSVGIAVFPSDGADAPTLLRNADTAMYHSKGRGKNQYSFFTSEMNAIVRRRSELEQALRLPNLGDAFFLEFQPQVWLADSELNGMEALVRWRRENGDIVTPGNFISIAEESGLIHGLGQYVISEACHAASHWILNRKQIKRVSVNVTARELLEPTFAENIVEALDDSGLDPGHLELEISENHLMQRLDGAHQLLSRFTDMGMTIAIDDFGAGYSSLALLQRLPVTRIKIDRTLVRDIGYDSNAEAIATAIFSMAQSLGLETVAVGIETERQLEILRRIGCEMGQGYLFGAPKRPESV